MKVLDPLVFARLGLGVLGRLPPSERGQVVLVSSAARGEGKTFIAALLARQFAEQVEGATALVDASYAGGRLLNAAEVTSPEGFADIVEHGQLPAGALQSTQSPRLTRITQGLMLRPDLMFSPFAVERALESLRERFRLTVVDAPVLSRCGALARFVDSAVVVVDSSLTPHPAIRRAIDRAGLDDARIAGVVLNRHRPRLPAWAGAD